MRCSFTFDRTNRKTPLVATTPLRFGRIPGLSSFGKLSWRGGLVLTSEDKRFGGFSGIEVSTDGKRFYAVSDDGWWFKGGLVYKDGYLTDVRKTSLAPLLSRNGKRSKHKNWRDAESVAGFDKRKIDGRLIVGMERRERLEIYNTRKRGTNALPARVGVPRAISKVAHNRELESVGRFWEGPHQGWYIAISEGGRDSKGNSIAWLWRGSKVRPFSIQKHGEFSITDLTILQGGKTFLTLERSFSTSTLPGMAIRRYSINSLKRGEVIKGDTLFEGHQPLYAVDNMEGLANHVTDDGEIRLTVISDDNYNRSIQSTLLLQFALKA